MSLPQTERTPDEQSFFDQVEALAIETVATGKLSTHQVHEILGEVGVSLLVAGSATITEEFKGKDQ